MLKRSSLRNLAVLLISAGAIYAHEPALPKLPLTSPPAPFLTRRADNEPKIFKPDWVGQEIVAGNKRLAMNQEGAILFYADGRELAKFQLPFSLEDKRTGKNQWLETNINCPKEYFDLSKSGIVKCPDALVYRKTFVYDGKSTECITTLRLQPDGKVFISYRWTPFDSSDFQLVPKNVRLIISTASICGENFQMDEETQTIPEGGESQSWTKRHFKSLVVFSNVPGKSIAILGTANSGDLIVDQRKDNVAFRVLNRRDQNNVEILVDISKGVEARVAGRLQAGIDFKAVDALELPDFTSSRNLIQNSSFEQGLDCYWGDNGPKYYEGPSTWDKKAFTIDATQSVFGSHGLKLLTGPKSKEDFRFIGYPFKTFPVPLSAGRYTFSFYAKGEAGDAQRVSVWFPNSAWAGSRTRFLPIGWKSWSEPGAQQVFEPSAEWKRYAFTFEVPESMPVFAHISADSISGKSWVWLDGLQLEPGEKPTAYEARKVEATLLTSKGDNFLAPSDPINARIEISAAPNVAGNATVHVKDFFDQELFLKTVPFVCDPAGRARIELPLEGKLPRGIFVVRAQYDLKDGTSSYSLHRLSIMDSLENRHRLKALFSEDYIDQDAQRFNFREMLERHRKIGLGGKSHSYLWNREIWEEYAKYGIDAMDSMMYSLIAPYSGIHNPLRGFGIMRTPGINGLDENDPRFLIRDFNYDAHGEVTEEYLEEFKNAAKTIASENPWIPMWTFGIEIFSKFPVDWWSKDGSPVNAYRNYAKLSKAFYLGVKEGNPKARVYQDAPSNMSPERGIPETGLLLEETNKLGGFKFDMIGIHPYRKTPENPDLDADTQLFLSVLEKNGYGSTPIFWPESMHYGPYNVPKWGIVSESWLPPSCWYYGTLSYDMGWAEKISAAWRARSWLVALKYQDRVKSMMSSAFMNNFEMDLNLTPFATQKISNTLGRLLGNAYFKKDIRFAPYIRCYVFEDELMRPVAAVWCHHPKVDAGTMVPPEVTIRAKQTLQQIFDLMEGERTFSLDKNGDMKYAASSFPLFFRGKPGTLDAFIQSFENAVAASAEGASPLMLSGKPSAPDQIEVAAKNALSKAFEGELNNGAEKMALKIQPSGAASFQVRAPSPLSTREIVDEKLPLSIRSRTSAFNATLCFSGFLCPKAPGSITVDGEIDDWEAIAPIPLKNRYLRDKTLKSVSNADFSGWFKTAWTPQGIYICVKITDDKFAVKPFSRPGDRWNNDALQIFFDSFCDARSKLQQVCDENDYEYAVHPSADGLQSEVYRRRTPDPQLGLATQAPQNNTIAKDIPSAFKQTADGYVYEVFFPAKYLLPIRLEKGSAVGFGLSVNDRDDLQGDAKSSLTISPDGTDCSNQPQLWPAMLLWE
ncbi:MAG: sugar-binding protein [Chthoniobacteraceae bacterium]